MMCCSGEHGNDQTYKDDQHGRFRSHIEKPLYFSSTFHKVNNTALFAATRLLLFVCIVRNDQRFTYPIIVMVLLGTIDYGEPDSDIVEHDA